MTESHVRFLFVVTLLLLPLQLAYGKFAEETYPAVILPGFGAAADVGEFVTTKEFDLRVEFVDGRSREVDVTKLFGGVPGHRARGFLRNVAPANGEPKSAPAVRRWIRGNLTERFDREPEALVIDWRQRKYRRSDWTQVDDSKISERRVVFNKASGEQQ
jgi:hypothetical protein